MTEFKRGDVVTVYMSRNNVFPWQIGTSFLAFFRHAPSGPGDCFMVDVSEQNEVLLLNGNSPDFVGIAKAYPEE